MMQILIKVLLELGGKILFEMYKNRNNKQGANPEG